MRHNSLDGFIEILVVADLFELGILTEEWHECLDTFIVLFNLERKVSRIHVFCITFSKFDHSLLTFVQWADEGKDISRSRSISHQIFGLIDILWEVFEDDPWISFVSHGLNQGGNDGIVILVLKAVFFKEFIEIQNSQVSSLCKYLSDRVSSRTNGSKNAENLRKKRFLSLSINLGN